MGTLTKSASVLIKYFNAIRNVAISPTVMIKIVAAPLVIVPFTKASDENALVLKDGTYR